jgi:hypothetical protein
LLILIFNLVIVLLFSTSISNHASTCTGFIDCHKVFESIVESLFPACIWFKVLLTVATDHRFAEDGSDRFEAVSKAIEDGREGRKRESKLAALERQIAELKKLAGQ